MEDVTLTKKSGGVLADNSFFTINWGPQVLQGRRCEFDSKIGRCHKGDKFALQSPKVDKFLQLEDVTLAVQLNGGRCEFNRNIRRWLTISFTIC